MAQVFSACEKGGLGDVVRHSSKALKKQSIDASALSCMPGVPIRRKIRMLKKDRWKAR